MASEHKPDQRDGDRARAPPNTAAAEAALKAKLSRKRTKTGCLTCRKRRIKCGEERPVCKNCVKSKRQCEGYNQRVIFKPPTFDYQPVANGGAHITFQAGPVPGQANFQPDLHVPIPEVIPYGQLRPREPIRSYMTVFDAQSQSYVNVEAPQPASQWTDPSSLVGHVPPEQARLFPHGFHANNLTDSVPLPQHISPELQAWASTQASVLQSDASIMKFEEAIGEPFNPLISPAIPPTTLSQDHVRMTYEQPALDDQQPFSLGEMPHIQMLHNAQSWTDGKPPISGEQIPGSSASSHSPLTFPFSQQPQSATYHQWSPDSYVPQPVTMQPVESQQYHQVNVQHSFPVHQGLQLPSTSNNAGGRGLDYYEHELQAPRQATHTSMLNAAAVETVDDDYYDIDSDQEMDFDAQAGERLGQNRQPALNRLLALNGTNIQNLQMRRYDTFIYDGILEHYRVEEVASPLKNPATARVFAHFISATGPSLSVFERHPRSSAVLFAPGTVPFSQQGLWTYTMPIAALRNQGLLHAMLAIASLHIARLQNASVTPSMQHYAWALKRIHASVANHQKSRLKVTTIAASLLLGFYEIMTADHMKWNMHLAGSKQLLVETDFVKMARDFRRMKVERALRFQYGHQMSEGLFSPDDLLDQIPDVDEGIISHLVGKEVRYDNHGRVEAPSTPIPNALDLGKFEILKDLYWWYCKQDVYQSIVSGNSLLMDYSRWANCPPRAPLGKPDAVYGTFDHLILLLGRIADFVARDRARKLKQVQANGGQWRPAPGTKISRPPQPPTTPSFTTNGMPAQNHFGTSPVPLQSPSKAPGNDPSQFFGMAPLPRGNVRMPSSYKPDYGMPTPQIAQPAQFLDFDLETATARALEEYDQIRTALRTFATSLGPAFEPLTSEYQMPMSTAFGTARFYRSYDIGCMWAVYNMAEIIAIRSHPHMPPAAHFAAGVAAKQTAPFANEIGRIAAGIVPSPAEHPLNPTLGAALCESCMPSFFAGVQYQDANQRHETVTRIFSIAKRTGWGSAELIANGLETAWVKAAEAGRGPPYQRVVRPQEYNEDPRLNGSWEYLDPNAQPEENNENDRRLITMKKEARLTWAIGVMGVEDDVGKIRMNE